MATGGHFEFSIIGYISLTNKDIKIQFSSQYSLRLPAPVLGVLIKLCWILNKHINLIGRIIRFKLFVVVVRVLYVEYVN